MSFLAHETSVESSTPVEIYHFLVGTVPYFYTSAEEDQLVGAQNYTAVLGLQRGPVAEGPDKREAEFSIELPTMDAVAQTFVGTMPGLRVRVTVSRFHSNDTPTPEVVGLFEGYVESAGFSKGMKLTTLTARSELGAVGLQIPRRTFQGSCNHVLYNALTCQVDDTDVAFRASALDVSTLAGSTLTVTSGLMGTYADGWMEGGYVEVIGVADYRMVRVHVGNVLTLHGTFGTTPALVNVFAGCAHIISICSSKFNNVDRFGGFPAIPLRDVHQAGLV